MEVAPRYWQNPDTLKDVYVSTSGGPVAGTASSILPAGTVAAKSKAGSASTISVTAGSARNANTNAIANSGRGTASAGSAVSTSLEKMVPLVAITSYKRGNTPLAVNHQGPFVAATISFNLAVGKSLSDAATEIDKAIATIHMPNAVHGSLQGTARTFQSSLDSEPFLIAAALVAVYIVLGILYESYIHPITIFSTLPSAGVGALLALIVFDTEFSIIALIGVILLIGIVKKNAIMMIDFALEAQRVQGLNDDEAIFQACLLRFRPIMMTTSRRSSAPFRSPSALATFNQLHYTVGPIHKLQPDHQICQNQLSLLRCWLRYFVIIFLRRKYHLCTDFAASR